MGRYLLGIITRPQATGSCIGIDTFRSWQFLCPPIITILKTAAIPDMRKTPLNSEFLPAIFDIVALLLNHFDKLLNFETPQTRLPTNLRF
jgi:hypothetical protein